jgi:hypothetical protein
LATRTREYTITPNAFAYAMLFGWPLISMAIYRRLPVARATIWSILGAYLILPVGTTVDPPLFPPLDKVTIPNFAAFFICRFMLGRSVPFSPRLRWERGLMLVYVSSPFITAFGNSDAIVAGPRTIAGMDYYDALSDVIRQSLFILPFALGRHFLNAPEHSFAIMRALVIAGLVYSVPMLFEARMSPQLHNWIYGYFPHSFAQQMRGEGFRPVVFLGHGLWIAFFAMTSLAAVTMFWRLRLAIRGFSAAPLVAYMGIVLLFCKSLASTVYAGALVFFIRFLSPRYQLRIACLLVLVVIAYPLLRAADLFPVNEIKEAAAAISAERSESFQFRLNNEELLLAHVRTRALFGWGSWGRNRVYDTETGKDLTVTDGRWIIVMSQYGWVGYIAEFGLLALPVIRSLKTFRLTPDSRDRVTLTALTLILAISVVDLLLNASVTPWTWLIAGALSGRYEYLTAQSARPLPLRHSQRTF